MILTKSNNLVDVVPKEAVTDWPYRRVTRQAPKVVAAATDVYEFLAPNTVINVQ